MAYETVAQIVDLALLVRQDNLACPGSPFSRYMPATGYSTRHSLDCRQVRTEWPSLASPSTFLLQMAVSNGSWRHFSAPYSHRRTQRWKLQISYYTVFPWYTNNHLTNFHLYKMHKLITPFSTCKPLISYVSPFVSNESLFLAVVSFCIFWSATNITAWCCYCLCLGK